MPSCASAGVIARLRPIIDPALAFVLLAVLWEYGAALFHLKAYLLPPLSKVLATLWDNRATLLSESLVTLQEVALGYLAALAGGLLLGLLIFAIVTARRALYPAIVLFQGLPKIALAPLLVVWFGIGPLSKVVMAFLFAFFPIVISTLGGLASTPLNLVEHFKAIGASPWMSFRRLRLPSALPSIVDGCRMAAPLAVIGAIAGEFVGAEQGLGTVVLMANANARTDLLFASLIAISILAGLLYCLIELIARRVWWRGL